MGRLLLELLELVYRTVLFEELLETLTGKPSSSTYFIVGLLELLTRTGALSTGNKTLLLSTDDDDDELDCMGISLFLFGIASSLPLAPESWLVCRDLGKSASTSQINYRTIVALMIFAFLSLLMLRAFDVNIRSLLVLPSSSFTRWSSTTFLALSLSVVEVLLNTSVCVPFSGFSFINIVFLSYLSKSKSSISRSSSKIPCCFLLSLSGNIFSLLVFASLNSSSYVGFNLNIYIYSDIITSS